MCLVEFGCEPVWTLAFLCGRLLIAASTSDLVIGLFRDLTSLGLVLGECVCPGICPFLLDLLVYCIRVFIVFFCISVG